MDSPGHRARPYPTCRRR